MLFGNSFPGYLKKYFNAVDLESTIKNELPNTELKEEVYEKDGFIVTVKSGTTPSGGYYSETTYSFKKNPNQVKLNQLNEDLNKAILEQNFELAAKLRDEIKELRKV